MFPSTQGPHVIGLTSKCEEAHLSGQERGSRIAAYNVTAEAAFSKEKLVSISAMPAYKTKSHEELRWEDYNFPGKESRGTTFTPVKPKLLGETFTSVATETTTWKYPGPTSTSKPFQFSATATAPFNPFIPRTNLASPVSTTVCEACFNPFIPRTTLTSVASSVTHAPLSHNPFINPSTHTSSSRPTFAAFTDSTLSSVNAFWSTPIDGPSLCTVTAGPNSLLVSPVSSFTPVKPKLLGETFPSVATETPTWKYPGPTPTSQPLQFLPTATTCLTTATPDSSNSFNPLIPRTNLASPASTTVCEAPFNPFTPITARTSAASTASSVSFAPLNHNSFTNPSTSLATHASSSSPAISAFTGVVDSTPNALWTAPVPGHFISTATKVANFISVSPVSSGSSSTFNPSKTLFNPFAPTTQNYNGTTTGVIDQSSATQMSSSQVTSMENLSPAASPFGTLPPKPHMFVDSSQSKQPIQYGISNIRVKDKPAPVKYSTLTARHLSRRIKLPVRKYDPKSNAPKIPYFSDTKEIPVAAYVPRENPRALVVGPEKWPPSATRENIHEEELSGCTYRDDSTKEKQLPTTILDVPAKLKQPDYYTQPEISKLEAKERGEPGYCRHVKDFVVGRHGYGEITFLGETDVRKVDIEAHVQFNNREVIVHMDDTPVGEGLNKAAEITLLNVKCIDKKTGMQHTAGSKINKYTEMLKKKAAAQGGEFVSYDPVEGEWKFRVQHF